MEDKEIRKAGLKYLNGTKENSELEYRGFFAGAKYSESVKDNLNIKDIESYAKFCVMCDRKKQPLIFFNDWVKLESNDF